MYANHVEERGEGLFALACDFDLEGIVAKPRSGTYLSDGDETSRFKIRNRGYSQMMMSFAKIKRRIVPGKIASCVFAVSKQPLPEDEIVG